MAIAIIDGKFHRIEIEQDLDPLNPREHFDHLGTMVCWHRRYTLGDEQPESSPREYRERLACGFDSKLEARLERLDDLEAVNAVIDKHIIELPLYLYDHSGITMSTGSFSCAWDSGQVGFIYVTKEAVRKEWGWKKLTKARIDKIYEILKSEVEEYAQYLEGDIYGFKHEVADFPEDFAVLSLLNPTTALDIAERNLELDDLDWEEEDSCWGFYGRNVEKNGMLHHLPKKIESLVRAAA